MDKPYYQDKYCTIYHGDCVEIMPQLEPVDLVLTDPPWIGGGIQRNPPGGVAKRYTDSIFKRSSVGNFNIITISDVISKATHDCFIMCGWREAIDIAKLGKHRGTFIWWKPNAPPKGFRPFRDDCSFIIWLGDKTYLKRQVYNSMIFKFPMLQAGCMAHPERILELDGVTAAHPCQSPIALHKEILKPFSNSQNILDPFMGSGTTLVAAKQLNRKAIGIEIEKKYCEIAVRRLAQEVIDWNE